MFDFPTFLQGKHYSSRKLCLDWPTRIASVFNQYTSMTLHLKDTPFKMHWMSQHSFQHTLNSTWLFCQWPISLDVPRQAPCSKIPACLFAVLFDLLFLNQMRVNKVHFERFHLPPPLKKNPRLLIGDFGIGAVNISVTSCQAPSSDTSGPYSAPVTCLQRW